MLLLRPAARRRAAPGRLVIIAVFVAAADAPAGESGAALETGDGRSRPTAPTVSRAAAARWTARNAKAPSSTCGRGSCSPPAPTHTWGMQSGAVKLLLAAVVFGPAMGLFIEPGVAVCHGG